MVLSGRPNPIRSLVDSVLLPRKVTLDIMAEVGGVQSALTLVERGVACSILPESALTLGTQPPRVQHAAIGPPAMWHLFVLAMPMARPLGRLAMETVKLLRELGFRRPG